MGAGSSLLFLLLFLPTTVWSRSGRGVPSPCTLPAGNLAAMPMQSLAATAAPLKLMCCRLVKGFSFSFFFFFLFFFPPCANPLLASAVTRRLSPERSFSVLILLSA